MLPALPDSDAEGRRALMLRRGRAVVLTLLIELLLLFAVLHLQQQPPPKEDASSIKTFGFGAAPSAAKAQAKAKATKEDAAPVKPTPPEPKEPIIAPKSPSQGFVPMSHDEFAATDISKLGSAKPSGATGTGKGSAMGPADNGPGNSTIYNAQWYREPGRGVLTPYLSASIKPGWGMIVCQTAPNYRVENCRALGESPSSPGLAQAMRRAAWQFQVVPPRIDGKAIVGAWVRVRFDLSVEKEEREAQPEDPDQN
jgi:hypothetical protein